MKKKEIIGLHLLFWVLIGNSLIGLSVAAIFGNPNSQHWSMIWSNLGGLMVMGGLFYLGYFSFDFLIKKKIRFAWILGIWILLSVYIAFQNQVPVRFNSEDVLTSESRRVFQLISGPTSFLVQFFYGLLLRAVVNGIQDGRLKRQLEKEKLTTQLELIKSQINPHFLFNTLNNIDILIKEDPDRASQFLNKLSDILRYSLYETKQDVVPLENELDNIRKYIELQKIRTQNLSFASFSVMGEPAGLTIPPMTLLPFVENAFKHSTNKKIEDAIVMTVAVVPESITFDCRNHCGDLSQLDENSSGLGMSLIRSRFELLFGDRFTLENRKQGDWYEVNLKIQLHDR